MGSQMIEGRGERAGKLVSKREGPWRAGRRRDQPRRKWAITGLESALPRAPSVGGFRSLPLPLCLPNPL